MNGNCVSLRLQWDSFRCKKKKKKLPGRHSWKKCFCIFWKPCLKKTFIVKSTFFFFSLGCTVQHLLSAISNKVTPVRCSEAPQGSPPTPPLLRLSRLPRRLASLSIQATCSRGRGEDAKKKNTFTPHRWKRREVERKERKKKKKKNLKEF